MKDNIKQAALITAGLVMILCATQATAQVLDTAAVLKNIQWKLNASCILDFTIVSDGR